MYSAVRAIEGKWYSSIRLERTLIFGIFESYAHSSDIQFFWRKLRSEKPAMQFNELMVLG